jgi:hypothetical protein
LSDMLEAIEESEPTIPMAWLRKGTLPVKLPPVA